MKRRQHFAHLAVDEIHCLQAAKHDLEMGDKAGLIETDHVDTVCRDPVDFGFEFDDDRLVARPLADKFGAWVVERRDGGSEIFDGDRLAALGRVDDRRLENGVLVDQAIEGGAVARKRNTIPVVDNAAVERVQFITPCSLQTKLRSDAIRTAGRFALFKKTTNPIKFRAVLGNRLYY